MVLYVLPHQQRLFSRSMRLQVAFSGQSHRTVLALMGVGNAAAIDDDEAIGLMVTALLMARSVAAVVARERPDLRQNHQYHANVSS